MQCLNLCEITNKEILRIPEVKELLNFPSAFSRVYFGSYFCSRYFLSINFAEEIAAICEEKGIKCTLVIPVFSQGGLNQGKLLIAKMVRLLGDYLDEFTVNDYGMLDCISSEYADKKINLGRLFFKEPRDPRIHALKESVSHSAFLETMDEVLPAMQINCIEIDEISDRISVSPQINTAVHYPFCFITTGFICKMGSVHQPLDHKFRSNGVCRMECQSMYEHYPNDAAGKVSDYYRIGRTVYSFNGRRAEVDPPAVRMIRFPFMELVGIIKEKTNENIGST